MRIRISNKIFKSLFLLSCFLLAACSNIEKSTRLAIEKSEAGFIQRECSLNQLFENEPEFFTFNSTTFCEGELEVLRIDSISETESVVDYKITFKAKQKKLNKWLRAYNAMAARKVPSAEQQEVKTLIEQIHHNGRDWSYNKQTVKLDLTHNGWLVKDIIR